ncbi:NEDD4 family-interacting protein 1 [Molossus nigricans]|uniref:Nedd4 family interacting protein 1 n=1 Tax=Molossus molossus TaxID=27622 RepID=A0A7J8IA46_MOLMO|nr:NEDD4 family-interacting protein 1 [Molossus molossus]KAF6481198.1 Nedd4 family interacting protein 1 [Molossus molossus]
MALALAALAAVEPACGSRYQQLQNEEEPGELEQVAGDAPPPYSSISAESAAVYFDYKDESGFPKPPSYNVATTLPSYDEAERTKAEATIPLVPGRDEDFVGRDDFDDADQLRIGNDGIFMLTFFMAFLFNWIGFFLSFCLTTSAAGRYGAISGFGLSLIKWILIVRFSTYFPGYFDGQYWLWWVFLVLGFLLFLRGFINYAKVRKMPETFSNLPRTRVLFIY